MGKTLPSSVEKHVCFLRLDDYDDEGQIKAMGELFFEKDSPHADDLIDVVFTVYDSDNRFLPWVKAMSLAVSNGAFLMPTLKNKFCFRGVVLCSCLII